MLGWYVNGSGMVIKLVDVPDPKNYSISRYRAGVIFVDKHGHTDGNMIFASEISADRLTAVECFMKTVDDLIACWHEMMDVLDSSVPEAAPVIETLEWWSGFTEGISGERKEIHKMCQMSRYFYKWNTMRKKFGSPFLTFLKCVADDRPPGMQWTASIKSEYEIDSITSGGAYSYDCIMYRGIASPTKEQAVKSLELSLGSVAGMLSALRQTAYDAYISIDSPECLIDYGNVRKA